MQLLAAGSPEVPLLLKPDDATTEPQQQHQQQQQVDQRQQLDKMSLIAGRVTRADLRNQVLGRNPRGKGGGSGSGAAGRSPSSKQLKLQLFPTAAAAAAGAARREGLVLSLGGLPLSKFGPHMGGAGDADILEIDGELRVVAAAAGGGGEGEGGLEVVLSHEDVQQHCPALAAMAGCLKQPLVQVAGVVAGMSGREREALVEQYVEWMEARSRK